MTVNLSWRCGNKRLGW